MGRRLSMQVLRMAPKLLVVDSEVLLLGELNADPLCLLIAENNHKFHSAPTQQGFLHEYSEAPYVFSGRCHVQQVVGGVQCLGAWEVDWQRWKEA
jgi:hypothetical protein